MVFSFCCPEVTETHLEGPKWIWRLQFKYGHHVVHYWILPGWQTRRVAQEMKEKGFCCAALATVVQWHKQFKDVKKKSWNTDEKEGSLKHWVTLKKKIFNASKYISYWEDYFRISSDRALRCWLILLRLVDILGVHLSIMKQRWLYICAQYSTKLVLVKKKNLL